MHKQPHYDLKEYPIQGLFYFLTHDFTCYIFKYLRDDPSYNGHIWNKIGVSDSTIHFKCSNTELMFCQKPILMPLAIFMEHYILKEQ